MVMKPGNEYYHPTLAYFSPKKLSVTVGFVQLPIMFTKLKRYSKYNIKMYQKDLKVITINSEKYNSTCKYQKPKFPFYTECFRFSGRTINNKISECINSV